MRSCFLRDLVFKSMRSHFLRDLIYTSIARSRSLENDAFLKSRKQSRDLVIYEISPNLHGELTRLYDFSESFFFPLLYMYIYVYQ